MLCVEPIGLGTNGQASCEANLHCISFQQLVPSNAEAGTFTWLLTK